MGAEKPLVISTKKRSMWPSAAHEKLTIQAQLSEVLRKDMIVQDVLSMEKMLLLLTRKGRWSCGGIVGLGQAYPRRWGGGGQWPSCCTGSLSPQPPQEGTASRLLPQYWTTVGAECWGESSQIMTGVLAPTSWGYSSVTTVNNFLLG